MILGVPGSAAEAASAAALAPDTHDSGSSDVGAAASTSIPGPGIEESGGGSRWPRQETLALLKIRSDMDVAFRDASLKAPLWEEVSRKMSELGFQRSSKKCREKFENVYKYHKRTKDGRASKPDGKTYRFFDQLEALENNPFNPHPHPQPPPRPPGSNPSNLHLPPPQQSYGASLPTSPTPLSVLPPPPQMGAINPSSSPFQPSPAPPNTFQPSHLHISTSFLSGSISTSSTSSDEDIRRRGRKRKWKDYLQRLIKDVIQKQEELQKKFLETLEKRERDRIVREEAWRVQEIARMNREQDLLVKERSMAAAKDAAVIAFLQKISDQHNLQLPTLPVVSLPIPSPQIPPPEAVLVQAPATATEPRRDNNNNNTNNNGDNFSPASSSRWPKAEVQSLINLRTSLDIKYQETGPKGPLWEEISTAMGKLGYNRSSKRCKEKWENINKYYKKVKESNKIRPEDSKTCPYFHQLEAIYKERAKHEIPSIAAAPIMARPEQQWPQHQEPAMQNQVLGNVGLNNDEDEEDEDDEDDEMMANQQPSPMTSTAE